MKSQAKPAPYSSTAGTELKSIDLLNYYLDKNFVKSDIRKLDKYPNTDGTIEITDADHFPIGKFDVQVKTLSGKAAQPKYQCDEAFIAYCETALYPVLLFVVDLESKKVYWQHINETVISILKNSITGKSRNLDIPSHQCLDGIDVEYINKWVEILADAKFKKIDYPYQIRRNAELERRLAELSEMIGEPLTINESQIRELHIFLDHFHHIIEVEFPIVKQKLYSNYWKISLSVIEYTAELFSFILFPVEYTKNPPLIQQMTRGFNYNKLREIFDEQNALVYANSGINDLKANPKRYAYYLLKGEIQTLLEKTHLPVEDPFLANEYLLNFINEHCCLLGFESSAPEYSIDNIIYLIEKILPIVIEHRLTFNPSISAYEATIDSYASDRNLLLSKKQIAVAEELLASGYESKVKVKITSSVYDIDLVKYYIFLLSSLNIHNVRPYAPAISADHYPIHNWITWDLTVLFDNLGILLDRYHDIYPLMLEQNFHIKSDILVEHLKNESSIYVLKGDEGKRKPYLERYRLLAQEKQSSEIWLFKKDDPSNPIHRDHLERGNWFIDFNHTNYRVVSCEHVALDFAFADMPIYSLVKKTLKDKLERFFGTVTRREK